MAHNAAHHGWAAENFEIQVFKYKFYPEIKTKYSLFIFITVDKL